MKKILLLLLIPITGFCQQFNGTIFDLESGRMQVISGSFSRTGDYATDAFMEINENYRRARIEREIKEQTRLLREIANQ